MWLPPALLLLSLPGECGWGLGDSEPQGQDGVREQLSRVPQAGKREGGVTSGHRRGGFVSSLSKSAPGSASCQACIHPEDAKGGEM